MAMLSEFNSSLETTREWLRDLMNTLATKDEAYAYRALRATLHELRDHLPVEEASHFAAQLPLLLKGVFYDGWRPAGKPVRERSKAQFLDKIAEQFRAVSHIGQVERIVRDVFCFLNNRLTEGAVQNMVTSLPKEIRQLWPSELRQPRVA